MRNTIYLDNAATTYPKPKEVYNFMDEYNRKHYGSFNRSTNSVHIDIVSETRELLLNLFNANSDYEVSLQSSATEAMNTVLRGIDYFDGMNIYLTHFEHNATVRTLYDISNKYKVNFHYLAMSKEKNYYDLDEISKQFIFATPDVLVMTHASNAFGLITPIEKIIELLDNKARIVIDGAQTAGLLNTDLSKLKVDAYIYAGHKTLYGPFGVGGMIKHNRFNLKPLITGGTGNDSASKVMPNDITRFEAGTRNLLSISGLYKSLQWMTKIGVNHLYEQECEIKDCLLEILDKYDYIEVYKFNNQIGVVSIRHNDLASDEFAKLLNERGIITRVGLHCSPHAHEWIGTAPGGTVRLSISYFTTSDELSLLDEILEDLEYIL